MQRQRKRVGHVNITKILKTKFCERRGGTIDVTYYIILYVTSMGSTGDLGLFWDFVGNFGDYLANFPAACTKKINKNNPSLFLLSILCLDCAS